MPLPRYVLITPARNEAQFIELALKSVVAQTVLPAKWIIVSDGSTDGTDEIVLNYARIIHGSNSSGCPNTRNATLRVRFTPLTRVMPDWLVFPTTSLEIWMPTFRSIKITLRIC